MYGETLDFEVSISNGSKESSTANLLRKIGFPIGYFFVTIADADIGNLKFLHTLFDKYLDHMLVKFEQNHRWKLHKILRFSTKNGEPFLTKF